MDVHPQKPIFQLRDIVIRNGAAVSLPIYDKRLSSAVVFPTLVLQ
jgi:hypothetical protein